VPWTAEQVLAYAPDAASAKAGQEQATPAVWSGLGSNDRALWGLCQGSGAQVIVMLALSDDGAPAYDHDNAAFFAALGCPAFACTPDQFPDLIAAAIERRDIGTWAAKQDIVTSRAE
jgi:hypothetical protein